MGHNLHTFAALSAILCATTMFYISTSNKASSLENQKFWIEEFSKWSVAQKRLYSTPEEINHRMTQFQKSYKKVQSLKKLVDYEVTLGPFADLSEEEFFAQKTGLIASKTPQQDYVPKEVIKNLISI